MLTFPLFSLGTTTRAKQQDLASAERLAAELQQYLKEEEIYRVDHYMVSACALPLPLPLLCRPAVG